MNNYSYVYYNRGMEKCKRFLNKYSRIVFRNFIVVHYKKCYNVFQAK